MSDMEKRNWNEMDLVLYIERQLDAERAREIGRVLDESAEARQLYRALLAESKLLETSMTEADEAVPARLLTAPQKDAVPWGWLTGLGFAGAGAYWIWGIFSSGAEQLGSLGFGWTAVANMALYQGATWKGWDDVFNLINFLALATVAVVAGYIWRRYSHRNTTLAVVMGLCAAFLSLPAPAAAAEIRKDPQTVVIRKDEVVKNDLIVYAPKIRVEGTIEGDLIAACEGLEVNGRVTGDIIGFARQLSVNGTVDGNLRVFANILTLNGKVEKNVIIFTQTMDMNSKGSIGGGLIGFGESLTLDGPLGRDLLAFGSRTSLNSSIGGAVRAGGDRLTIGPDAAIQGKVYFRGKEAPRVHEQAKLAAGKPEFEKMTDKPKYGDWRFYWRRLLSYGTALVLGVVLILIAPSFLQEATRHVGRYGASFGAGALALLATPILAIAAMFTVVGIATSVVALALWCIALYAAQIFLAHWVGRQIMGVDDTTGGMIVRLALGLLLVRIAVNLPAVGGIALFIALLWGMGAMTLAIVRRIRPEPVLA